MMLEETDIEALMRRNEVQRGMSFEQIARLSSFKIGERMQLKFRNENCSICLDNFKKGD